jgi:hypothetical protein
MKTYVVSEGEPKRTEARKQSRLPRVVAGSTEGGVERVCTGELGGVGYTLHKKTGCDCNDVQPAAVPCSDWDTQRRVLKSKGIGKQAEKVGVEMSRKHTVGGQTCWMGP